MGFWHILLGIDNSGGALTTPPDGPGEAVMSELTKPRSLAKMAKPRIMAEITKPRTLADE